MPRNGKLSCKMVIVSLHNNDDVKSLLQSMWQRCFTAPTQDLRQPKLTQQFNNRFLFTKFRPNFEWNCHLHFLRLTTIYSNDLKGTKW